MNVDYTEIDGGSVFASGRHSCSFRPPIKCKHARTRRKNTISKLIHTKYARRELQNNAIVQWLDPKYHLGIPESCPVGALDPAEDNVEKCPQITDISAFDKKDFVLFQLPDGGTSLEDYITSKTSSPNLRKVARDLYPIIWGLADMYLQKIIHFDLKSPNIVYREKEGEMFLIDFNTALKMEKVKRNDSKLWTKRNYYLAPIDVEFLHSESTPLELVPNVDGKSGFLLAPKSKKQVYNRVRERFVNGVGNYNAIQKVKRWGNYADLGNIMSHVIGISGLVNYSNKKGVDAAWEHCVLRFDIYSMGLIIGQILEWGAKSDPALAQDLRELAMIMANSSPLKRINGVELLRRYEKILAKHVEDFKPWPAPTHRSSPIANPVKRAVGRKTKKSSAASRKSPVASRKSPVASRKSPVASRKSSARSRGKNQESPFVNLLKTPVRIIMDSPIGKLIR
jgi:serine/threonine protein kinase